MDGGGVLHELEAYYDAAPRPLAKAEEVGPFTLFLRTDLGGWPYYARPRLGLERDVTPFDVRRARERQREVGAPERFEWVHETTPSMHTAARRAGLTLTRCPLLVLDRIASSEDDRHRVEVVGADDDVLGLVVGAIAAGFDGIDAIQPARIVAQPRLIGAGLLTMVAAYDDEGSVVGGGSHGPRGSATELTGIAVVPRARHRGIGAAIVRALVVDARERGVDTVFLSAQDDRVARVYERAGFVRVATACTGSVS